MIEIEKTFLVKQVSDNLPSYKLNKIKQGYISNSPSPLRIRQKDNKFEITKKLPLNPGNFSAAEEINIPLTEFEFNKLWSLVERCLEKDRYNIPIGDNLIAELDIYKGDLEGLSVVEVEFVSEEQMNSFKPLEWFGKDITQEDFSSNSFLAGKKFEEIKQYL